MDKVFLNIQQLEIELEHGVTIGIGRMRPVKSGWVVKLPFGQNLEGKEGMLQAIEIASKTSQFISGWKDDEVELWDVVEIFENEDEATKAGKHWKQMSIYQIETAKLKWLD